MDFQKVGKAVIAAVRCSSELKTTLSGGNHWSKRRIDISYDELMYQLEYLHNNISVLYFKFEALTSKLLSF